MKKLKLLTLTIFVLILTTSCEKKEDENRIQGQEQEQIQGQNQEQAENTTQKQEELSDEVLQNLVDMSDKEDLIASGKIKPAPEFVEIDGKMVRTSPEKYESEDGCGKARELYLWRKENGMIRPRLKEENGKKVHQEPILNDFNVVYEAEIEPWEYENAESDSFILMMDKNNIIRSVIVDYYINYPKPFLKNYPIDSNGFYTKGYYSGSNLDIKILYISRKFLSLENSKQPWIFIVKDCQVIRKSIYKNKLIEEENYKTN